MKGAILGVSIVAGLVLLAAAAQASAAQRFASPTGTGTACTEASPCSLQTAVEDPAVMDGDEVIMAPGDYVESDSLVANDAINIHGVAGQPRPRIFNSGVQGLLMASFDFPSRIAHLELYHSGIGQGIGLIQGVVEDVFVRSSGQAACHGFGYGGTLRDSVCWGVGTDSLRCGCGGSGFDSTTRLLNDTLIATGPTAVAIHAQPSGGAKIRYEGRNVIASGGFVDLLADADATSLATIELDYSNFDTSATSGAPGASAQQPGSASNQTGAPAFADAENGDFREAFGSPTIDAGVDDGSLATVDLDGATRVQGATVDIGAYEHSDTDPPETAIVNGPKKKTKRRKAKFEFAADEPGSSFQCKLDKADFAPCDAAETFRVKRKKHTLEVRAVDAAGNVDPTPATDSWKVKKKRKKK